MCLFKDSVSLSFFWYIRFDFWFYVKNYWKVKMSHYYERKEDKVRFQNFPKSVYKLLETKKCNSLIKKSE